jgi:hypothetical protein
VDFVAVVDQVIALLRQRGRVTYRLLKRQFQLDDEALEDLKIELIDGQRLATDEQGTVLVWTGEATALPAVAAAPAPASAPLGYTPPYLAEKILTSRSALEGERKQVTVLFADIKGSTELIAGLDPEEARTLLDPALRLMMQAVHRYEGTVNQVLGDGIMALFGAPLAHEDHAVRACYAALAMQEAMQRYTERIGSLKHFLRGPAGRALPSIPRRWPRCPPGLACRPARRPSPPARPAARRRAAQRDCRWGWTGAAADFKGDSTTPALHQRTLY